MQTSDAYILGRRIKYLDPLAICEAKHHGPNMWKEDHDLFKNYDADVIFAPYNIRNHWITFALQPKIGRVLVFDSLDWPKNKYTDFLFILRMLQYIALNGAHPPEKPKEMTLRTHFSCHKQPACSVYCGYYLCEHIRLQGRYTIDPENDHPQRNYGILHEKQLLEVVADLCRFIMHEVINLRGTFYDKHSELATESKYLGLREWENKKHYASSSSIGK
ncbi:hypothetical protein PVAP13_5KG350714 [Panicum virgatum]|uniref:Ubiquitin-like protease family profile domain-containing protein n=1 Tax=Panicum virgatum TaxID=38727 RepID=A0A8T0SP26_PANVG|nr:hypothetical protein PVAP13_5KG350714 [Panicum virgatum]